MAVAVAFVAGCTPSGGGCDGDAPQPSFHAQAAELMGSGGSIDQCIELQQKAVDRLREGSGKEPAVDVLSQMGYFHSRHGDFLNGLMFLQEAADSLSLLRAKGETLSGEALHGAIKLYGNTSNLYTRMGLYDEALAMNNEALALCGGDETDSYRCDLWRMRGAIYEYQSKHDPAMHCYRKALEAAVAVGDSTWRTKLTARAENDIAYLIIEHPDYMPDSIAAAVATLEKNMSVNSLTVPVDSLLIGRGYVMMGNPAKGIAMIRSQIPANRTHGDEDLEFALSMLSQSLVESALAPADYAVYMESRRMTDSIESRLKANALIGADFRYRTSRIMSDKLALEKELGLTRQRNLLLAIIFMLAAAIIAAAISASIRRKNRLLQAHRREIDNLLDERIRLNSMIEKALGGGNIIENHDVEPADTSALLSMILLTQEDEMRFRKLFATLHPRFIADIRNRYPAISPNAELVVMLIRLQKSNDEIALALGIKRESVAKARYRLRLLFKLPKETELNEFIMQL